MMIDERGPRDWGDGNGGDAARQVVDGPGVPTGIGPCSQAYNTIASPRFQSGPSTPASPAWDNSGLIAALNSLYQQGGWVMDSGASSHMTSDDSNLFASAPLSTP